MYGQVILCGISKGTFEIPHKISYPYIERCVVCQEMKIKELPDLQACKRFWNAPLVWEKPWLLWLVQAVTKHATLSQKYFLYKYRKISNISHTKSQNLNDSRLVLRLSPFNTLEPGVKSRMKM